MTPEERQFILDNCFEMSAAEISRRLGWRWPCRVRRVYEREGIEVPKELVFKWRAEKNIVRMTDEEIDIIIKSTKAGVPQLELAKKLRRGPNTIQRWQRELGLQKYLERNYRNAKKGVKAWNKGLPVEKWGLSDESLKKMQKTQFKKGNSHNNNKDIGEISIRGKKTPYKHIKVDDNKWMLYQRYLWEKEHGPIPEGKIVSFIDGDPMNCKIDNLELIDRHTSIIRNSIHDYPDEIVDTIVLRGKLKKRIKEIKDGSKK